jgi:hypothetical protein
MGAHILLPLAVNSKSKRKVDSLLPLGLEPATFGTQAHYSVRSVKFRSCIHSFVRSFFIYLYIIHFLNYACTFFK